MPLVRRDLDLGKRRRKDPGQIFEPARSVIRNALIEIASRFVIIYQLLNMREYARPKKAKRGLYIRYNSLFPLIDLSINRSIVE